MVSKYSPVAVTRQQSGGGDVEGDIESQLLLGSRCDMSDDTFSGEFYVVKCPAVGTQTMYGLASAYDRQYPAALRVPALGGRGGYVDLLSRAEYDRIIDRANDIILCYWPCTFLHVLSSLLTTPALLLFYQCLYGLHFCRHHITALLAPSPGPPRPVVYPDYVTMEGESKLKHLLEQFSLKASFYDNGITVRFCKAWVFHSWLEFRFPMKFVNALRAAAGGTGSRYGGGSGCRSVGGGGGGSAPTAAVIASVGAPVGVHSRESKAAVIAATPAVSRGAPLLAEVTASEQVSAGAKQDPKTL